MNLTFPLVEYSVVTSASNFVGLSNLQPWRRGAKLQNRAIEGLSKLHSVRYVIDAFCGVDSWSAEIERRKIDTSKCRRWEFTPDRRPNPPILSCFHDMMSQCNVPSHTLLFFSRQSAVSSSVSENFWTFWWKHTNFNKKFEKKHTESGIQNTEYGMFPVKGPCVVMCGPKNLLPPYPTRNRILAIFQQ